MENELSLTRPQVHRKNIVIASQYCTDYVPEMKITEFQTIRG
jgi:hypothetical protein